MLTELGKGTIFAFTSVLGTAIDLSIAGLLLGGGVAITGAAAGGTLALGITGSTILGASNIVLALPTLMYSVKFTSKQTVYGIGMEPMSPSLLTELGKGTIFAFTSVLASAIDITFIPLTLTGAAGAAGARLASDRFRRRDPMQGSLTARARSAIANAEAAGAPVESSMVEDSQGILDEYDNLVAAQAAEAAERQRAEAAERQRAEAAEQERQRAQAAEAAEAAEAAAEQQRAEAAAEQQRAEAAAEQQRAEAAEAAEAADRAAAEQQRAEQQRAEQQREADRAAEAADRQRVMDSVVPRAARDAVAEVDAKVDAMVGKGWSNNRKMKYYKEIGVNVPMKPTTETTEKQQLDHLTSLRSFRLEPNTIDEAIVKVREAWEEMRGEERKKAVEIQGAPLVSLGGAKKRRKRVIKSRRKRTHRRVKKY
jgi:hypothetical protein